MRQVFLEHVRIDPLLDGQNYIHMHYADINGNGYDSRGAVSVSDQGMMLNPDQRFISSGEQPGHRQRRSRKIRKSCISRQSARTSRLDPRREVPNVSSARAR